jgi:hypothetical protein
MAPHLGEADWRPIAEQASKQVDPAKLMILIGKLCRALEVERRQKSRMAVDPVGTSQCFRGD